MNKKRSLQLQKRLINGLLSGLPEGYKQMESKQTIEFRYQHVKSPDYQQKLDEIFDFIFEETISQMELDNSQGFSYTYNRLQKGVKNGRK